jgi:hypothetical protein
MLNASLPIGSVRGLGLEAGPLSIDVAYGVSRQVDPPRASERPASLTVPETNPIAYLLMCHPQPDHGGTIAGKRRSTR